MSQQSQRSQAQSQQNQGQDQNGQDRPETTESQRIGRQF